ncbi:MAG: hypothetical protein AAFQ92_18130 [Bacteroidota bacterium]
MNNQQKFWGIVELFGHTTLSGEVSKCEIGDFIQINIPEVGPIPAWSKMVNPKAIYGITPTTEDVARQKAETLKSMPIDRWDTEKLLNNRFAELEQKGKIKRLEAEAIADDDHPY